MSAIAPVGPRLVPDPQVPAKATRRRILTDHKLSMLRQVEACLRDHSRILPVVNHEHHHAGLGYLTVIKSRSRKRIGANIDPAPGPSHAATYSATPA